MHVQSNIPASGPLELCRGRAVTAGGAGDSQEPERARERGESPAPAGEIVSGPSSALLTSQTLGGVLAQGQDDGGSPVPSGVRDDLARIARDARYAADQAGAFAHGTRAVCMKPPANGAPASEWQAFSRTVDAAREQLDRVQAEKTDLYQRETANGTAPAEVYAHMLELELAQPQGYWAAMDPAGQLGDLRGNAQIRLAVLREEMAQAGRSAA
ncbi:MAG: hypothetical protein ACM33T_10325 [Solirubrobacterales bacterium]